MVLEYVQFACHLLSSSLICVTSGSSHISPQLRSHRNLFFHPPPALWHGRPLCGAADVHALQPSI